MLNKNIYIVLYKHIYIYIYIYIYTYIINHKSHFTPAKDDRKQTMQVSSFV